MSLRVKDTARVEVPLQKNLRIGKLQIVVDQQNAQHPK